MQNNRSQFDGSVLELAVCQVLAGVLAAFTFGIAAPWGIVMLKKYEIEHTIVDGNRLKFDGEGKDLLARWIVWLLLTLVTVGIYGFWLEYNMLSWVAEHTHIDDNVVNNTTNTREVPVNRSQDSAQFN